MKKSKKMNVMLLGMMALSIGGGMTTFADESQEGNTDILYNVSSTWTLIVPAETNLHWVGISELPISTMHNLNPQLIGNVTIKETPSVFDRDGTVTLIRKYDPQMHKISSNIYRESTTETKVLPDETILTFEGDSFEEENQMKTSYLYVTPPVGTVRAGGYKATVTFVASVSAKE